MTEPVASPVSSRLEWACIAAQQEAEVTVKALYMKQGADIWGHTVTPPWVD
jgi:HEPN domain-containing protein